MHKVYSMLGIAAKSGNVKSGEFSTEKALKSGKAYLVIVAGDASENTKKMFSDMSTFYGVPIEIFGTKEALGTCIGKDYRASLAITDEHLACAVTGKLRACKTE